MQTVEIPTVIVQRKKTYQAIVNRWEQMCKVAPEEVAIHKLSNSKEYQLYLKSSEWLDFYHYRYWGKTNPQIDYLNRHFPD